MCTTRDSLPDPLILDIQTQTRSFSSSSSLFSNRTGLVLTMNLQLVQLAIGLIAACLPSGKMEGGGGGGLGLEEKEREGLEQQMTLGYHPHHLLYI